MPQPRRGRGSRDSGDGDRDLTPDALAPKPGEEGAKLIIGIVGESDDADHVRIYLDLEFRKSYDLPAEAVLRRERLSAEQSPLGVDSSAVWVRPDTVLKLHQTETRRVEDEFLAGDFTAAGSFQPLPEAGGVGGPQLLRTVDSCGIVACPPQTIDSCGIVRCSAVDACPSRIPDFCPGHSPVAGICGFSPNPRICGISPNPRICGGHSPLQWRCPPSPLGVRCPPSRFDVLCGPSALAIRCGQSVWGPCIPPTEICGSEIDACPSALGCV